MRLYPLADARATLVEQNQVDENGLHKPPYPIAVQALLIGGVEADSARWETADSARI